MSAGLTRMLAARPPIEKVLGKAVHPAAIDRLLELRPEALVFVTHVDGQNDGVPLKITWVEIWDREPKEEGARMVLGVARCRLDYDRWVRRKGIALAFNRALKQISRPEPEWVPRPPKGSTPIRGR